MYSSKRRGSPFGSIIRLIVIGALAGAGFLIYQSTQSDNASPAPLVAPTTAASVAQAPAPENAGETTNVSEPLVPVSNPIGDANLFIPNAAIIAPIVETYLDGVSWDVSELGMNVGHLQGTSWTNSGPGNIVLSAHVEMRDGRAGVFANINELAIGDRIFLNHEGGEWQYAVVAIQNVDPTDLTPLYPSDTEKLTLITCDSYDFFSDSYQERTVVVAERIS